MLEALPQSLPSVEQGAVARFGALVRERFGLAHCGRRGELLEHRLREAMTGAGWREGAEGFVRAFAEAGEQDPVSLAVADAVTNQETSFFRDVAQLQAMLRELVPVLSASAAPDEPLRILSAGCSTGEEAYSLAMLLLDAPQLLWGRRLQLVGIDVSQAALGAAREGCYRCPALARAGHGPADWPRRFFVEQPQGFAARGLLRAVTSFRRANLVDPESLKALGRFDLVLCRNVLIYFDAETLRRASEALFAQLRPGGALVLGHAESGMAASLQGFARRSAGLLWYRRPEDG